MNQPNHENIIIKDLPLDEAHDYKALRAEGMALIRQLSGHIWTDHNLHDPGITSLEALCYALTDLSYRTSFSTLELLSSQPDYFSRPSQSGFFPAHEALTCGPATLLDYRQLLVRIEGVRNAWLRPRSPVEDSRALPWRFHQDSLNGLYDVTLELEPDVNLGSLNENSLPVTLINSPFDTSDAILSLVLDDKPSQQAWAQLYKEIIIVDEDGNNPNASNAAGAANAANVANIDRERLKTSFTFSFKGIDTHTTSIKAKFDGKALPELIIRFKDPVPSPVVAAKYKQLLLSVPNQVLVSFIQKQYNISQVLSRAAFLLQSHRGLCEDYASIKTVDAEYVGICADVDVAPSADLESVLAEVSFQIEQYLNPPIQFHRLSELLASGKLVDDIYDTPYIDDSLQFCGKPLFAKSGFVLNEELLDSDLRVVIYSSDLINLIMDVEGVENVRSLQLRKYNAQGESISDSEKWSLAITPGHQPVLSLANSKLLLFKQDIPFTVNPVEFEATLNHLRFAATQAAYTYTKEQLPAPVPNPRDTLTHYPVQHDFPETFQIGETGLRPNQDIETVNHVRQFKGYLMCFEQVLADYLAQLHHLPDLFSLDDSQAYSYYSQYLDNIQGSLEDFTDEFYVEPSRLSSNEYRCAMYEDLNQASARKNRLLDHLLARFAEQFSDYVMLMINTENDTAKTQARLIEDKKAFIKQQPELSRERGLAFNYMPEAMSEVWDSPNVSGLHKRLSKLSGIRSKQPDDAVHISDLSCQVFAKTLIVTRRTGEEHRIEIQDKLKKALFKSKAVYEKRSEAQRTASTLFEVLHQRSAYEIEANSGTGTVKLFIVSGENRLEHSAEFDSQVEAQRHIDKLLNRYYEVLESEVCNQEGMYVIEHLLLRPLSADNLLLPTCASDINLASAKNDLLDNDFSASCDNNDPYSFKASIVLPYWPRRFLQPSFRDFFEKLAREQAPAHIHLKVCWIDDYQMREFETKYKALLHAKRELAMQRFDLLDKIAELDVANLQTKYEQAQNEFIDIFNRLKTVYPTAVLHDCDDDADEAPVRLGQTNLSSRG